MPPKNRLQQTALRAADEPAPYRVVEARSRWSPDGPASLLWLLPLAEKAGRSSCSANIWDLERIARVFAFDYVAPY